MTIHLIPRLIAIALFIFLIPLLVVLVFISFLFHGLPIFFKQKRVGLNFDEFDLFKFRTLNGLDGHSITIGQDIRITKWGQFLRRWKLDELPQLINIIKGDMGFIGPRPEVPEFVSIKTFPFLESVRPGLSDFASIILIDESEILDKIHHSDPYRYILPLKLSLANYYVDVKGVYTDISIALLTLIAIIFPNFASWWTIKFMLKDYFKEHPIDSLGLDTVVKSR